MSTPKRWKPRCFRTLASARRRCSPRRTRSGARSAWRTWCPAPATASCASSFAAGSPPTRCPPASCTWPGCRATRAARWTGSGWRRVFLQQRPELGWDLAGPSAGRLDAHVHRGGGGQMLPALAEQVVLDAEAAVADPPDRQTDRHQLAGAERPFEGGLRVPQRKAVLPLSDELLERHPRGAEELLVRLVAVDEDVREEDDAGRVGVLKPDAKAVLENGHLGSGCEGVIHRPWTPSVCPWFPPAPARSTRSRWGSPRGRMPAQRGCSTDSADRTRTCASR